MKGRTHEVFGACAAVAASEALHLPMLDAVPLAVVASGTSRWADELETGLAVLMPWRWRVEWLRIYVVPLKHREATHKLLAGVIAALLPLVVALLVASGLAVAHPQLAALVARAGAILAAGVGVGYGMHLFADGCTLDGVKLVGGRAVHFLPDGYRIRTGSRAEGTVRWVVRVATVGLVLLAIPHAALT